MQGAAALPPKIPVAHGCAQAILCCLEHGGDGAAACQLPGVGGGLRLVLASEPAKRGEERRKTSQNTAQAQCTLRICLFGSPGRRVLLNVPPLPPVFTNPGLMLAAMCADRRQV